MHDHMNTAKYCLISVDYQSLNLQPTRKYEKKRSANQKVDQTTKTKQANPHKKSKF